MLSTRLRGCPLPDRRAMAFVVLPRASGLACGMTLSAVGWLGGCPVEFRTALLRLAEWRRVEAGQSIMLAGDDKGGLFGIAAGMVGFYTALSAPDAPMMNLGRPGMWFGEGVLICERPRIMSAVATTACELAYVPLPPLRTLLAANPAWWQHIAQLTLANSAYNVTTAADLMIRDTSRRSAAILLRLADRRFTDDASRRVAETLVTQDVLAAMANLSRSTMNAVLGRFADDGLISIHNRRIVIEDTVALRSFADDRPGARAGNGKPGYPAMRQRPSASGQYRKT